MGERVGAGADPGAGGGDGRGGLERDLIERADYVARWSSDHTTAARLRKAADAIGEARRAIEASRVWWDEDYSPYHIRWQHKAPDGGPCRCDVCLARDAARAAMEKLEGD